MKTINPRHYTLLNRRISPRLFIWLWFACPDLALVTLLSSRSREKEASS